MEIVRQLQASPILDMLGQPLSGGDGLPFTILDAVKTLLREVPREQVADLLARGPRIAQAVLAAPATGVLELLREDHIWIVDQQKALRPYKSALANMAVEKALSEFTEGAATTAAEVSGTGGL